ncbi:hypothetical protein BO86DRAFT_409864 [Aspergillus japonicus CBS 114.51]|uniref:Uncharacterized protein n=1 Tax=Aspergillus japonicus CBS 114.51 TaxID=1448312 RepID=A0A8T8X149_ASPJA|nr:hypothetical protein BO86DRAFT_409864 [Aspergillus japonicus CBS 114.51]RAH81761.1 hypothetical protein BO86DRAFT_409864 [Aspergillus japonicus CBS 114.51]
MSIRMVFHRLKKAYRALSAVILASWIVHVFSLVVVANSSPGITPNIVDHLASASLFIFLSPQNQHSHKSAVLFLICSVLWLRDLLSACVLLCMLTMFSIMLFMLVVLGLDLAMTTTLDARALGLRAWTAFPPTGREDLADQWTPEMARIMAFIYEEMDKGGINPDTADQWMVTWWFKVLLGLAWLNLLGLGWLLLGSWW